MEYKGIDEEKEPVFYFYFIYKAIEFVTLEKRAP